MGHILPYRNLQEGIHSFSFKLNNKFFGIIDYSEIKEGDLAVAITLNKAELFSDLDCTIEGTVDVICDRCLEPYNQEVFFSGHLNIRETENSLVHEEEETLFISSEEDVIDMSHYLYESIILNLPLRRIHPENKKGKSTCNKEMLNKIREHTQEKKNNEDTDPRWDELRKLN